ncbi:MAG: DUF4178 domain-containing protein [Bdellovibrionales bacterium]|nr:DUF4178 domain-containing protein [Bdellovibrionales bacterium]
MAGETAPKAKVFNCPLCGSTVQIRVPGDTISVVCTSCKSVIDARDENHRILSEAASRLNVPQVIPLGQRGRIRGQLWEVIGFMTRMDVESYFVWSEYLLYNPMRGYRWLTEADGHWNYVLPLKDPPKNPKGESVLHMGRTYRLYHNGRATVQYVVGEFYWLVFVGETVATRDLICPPEMLSIEKSKTEITYSIGEYLSPDEVREGFKITTPMPVAIGVAPNQPDLLAGRVKELLKIWGLFLIAIMMIQFLSIVITGEKEVYSGGYSYDRTDPVKTKTSPSFELTGGETGVKIGLHAPVLNHWFESQMDLVNETTGDVDELELGVEYYEGRDDEGLWSEGSRYTSAILPAVPDGKYHLNLEGSSSMPDILYSITVKRGAIPMSNFLMALFLISIFPLLLIWRQKRFEMARWSQSDFSPYHVHKDEE